MTSDVLPEPAHLTVTKSGSLAGGTGSYTKYLGDLEGVYLAEEAYREALRIHGPDHLAYLVEDHRNLTGPGALIIGTSTVRPGRIGDEYAMTRGHIHERADRAELYYCASGRGVMLMDTVDGESRAIGMEPGEAVHVPGHWIHRSINVGEEDLVMLFCYAADAGQDYEIIREAGGMVQLVVDDGSGGWRTTANPRHRGYRRSRA